jgi:hypothetical protein
VFELLKGDGRRGWALGSETWLTTWVFFWFGFWFEKRNTFTKFWLTNLPSYAWEMVLNRLLFSAYRLLGFSSNFALTRFIILLS